MYQARATSPRADHCLRPVVRSLVGEISKLKTSRILSRNKSRCALRASERERRVGAVPFASPPLLSDTLHLIAAPTTALTLPVIPHAESK